ncbi:MAG: response regulator [Sphingobacteriales bacterium JAD_PAG50586_3]|nr:MAG: response regulator [Sphingobacteriales bacterium JAD_PAG50586_3]
MWLLWVLSKQGNKYRYSFSLILILLCNGCFLIIEDNPADYFILNEGLKALGFIADKCEHITSLNELKKQLPLKPTFVFCDLEIEDSTGLATFKAVQEQYPNTPIVIISNTEDREVLFEAMQMGADDYLKKSQYDRMLLEKTVRFAQERRRYRKQMEVMELRYKSVVENSLVSFLLSERDGTILEANRAAVDMFGYSVDEMKAQGTHSIIDYSDPRIAPLIAIREKKAK